MAAQAGEGRREAPRWTAAILLALVAAAAVAIHLDRPGFLDNEGRYAEVAREMLLRRDLVTPEIDFTLFLNTPPLTFWLAAGAFALLGVNEWARIVVVLVAAGTIVCTCRLGARPFAEGTGLLAGLLLTTMVGFVLEARTLRPDMLIVASVAGAVLCWLRAEAAAGGGRARWLVAMDALLEVPGFVPPTYLEPHVAGMFLSRADFARRWAAGEPLVLVSDPQRRRESPAEIVPAPHHVLGRFGDRWVLGTVPAGAPS